MHYNKTRSKVKETSKVQELDPTIYLIFEHPTEMQEYYA